MSRLLSPRVAVSLPPMYAWPRPVKYALLALGLVLCLAAYLVMGAGLISLAGALLADR